MANGRLGPAIVQRCQHAVGRGGFHTGTVYLRQDKNLNYVFDCGSLQHKALRRQISAYCRYRMPVDVLFVSHFHDDHVNGLDTFLASAGRVENVVIPYLEAEDRALVVLGEMAAGRLTKALVDFVTSPEEWFRSRGVRNVFRLRPGGGGDAGPAAPGEPVVPGREGGGDVSIRIVNRGGEPPVRGASVSASHADNVFDIEPGAHVVSRQGGRVVDWLLLPYATRVSNQQLLANFHDRLKALIGADIGSQAFGERLLEFLKDGDMATIRHLYDLIAPCKDHNVVSLSLYSGPWPSDNRRRDKNHGRNPGRFCVEHWSTASNGYYYFRNSWDVGWLLTGDARLDRLSARSAPAAAPAGDWWSFYDVALDMTCRIMLPHHGSAANLPMDRPDLLDRFKLMAMYVTAKEGEKKHPSPIVRTYFPNLHVVTQNDGDELLDLVRIDQSQ
jgi:hypothetical protein